MRKLTIVLTVAVALILQNAACGLEVLEPGFVVETYVSFPYPAEVEGRGMPRGMTFDPYGNLYLTLWQDYPNEGSIYRVAPDGTVTEWLDGFGTPRRIVWAGGSQFGDYLYLTDGTPSVIYQIALDGTTTVFSRIGGGVHSLALDRSGSYGGNLYTATRATDVVYAVSPTGSSTLFSHFPGSVPGGHLDLAFDPGTDFGGLMYVALERPSGGSGVGGIFSIDQSGNPERFAPDIVSACNVAFDSVGLFDSDLFIGGKLDRSDPYYSIWRADPQGNISAFAAVTIGTQLTLATLTFGPDGAMYVPEYSFDEQSLTISRVIPVSPLELAVDIRPDSCPNPLNLSSRGVLPVAILGSEELDVNSIDVTSIRLEGIAPIRSGYEDVAAPVAGGEECDCTVEGPDGYTDLMLKFQTRAVVAGLLDEYTDLAKNDVVVLTLTGVLTDQTPIEGEDCIVIKGKYRSR